MYHGVTVRIGEEDYIIPPISLGQLRGGLLERLREHDRLVSDGKLFDVLEIRGQVILAALRRNYPDFPEDKLLDFLDMGNSGNIWLSVLGASGFTPGEEKAAKANGALPPSIEASPPPTAGPITK